MGAKCCGLKKRKVKPEKVDENENEVKEAEISKEPEQAEAIPVSESKVIVSSNEDLEAAKSEVKVEDKKVESSIGDENAEHLSESEAVSDKTEEIETVEEFEETTTEIIEENDRFEKPQDSYGDIIAVRPVTEPIEEEEDPPDYEDLEQPIQQRSNVLEEIEDIENREETEEQEEIYEESVEIVEEEILEEEEEHYDQETPLQQQEQSVMSVTGKASKTPSEKSDDKTEEFQTSPDRSTPASSRVGSPEKQPSLIVPTTAQSVSIIEIKESSQEPESVQSVIETPSFTGKRTSKVGPMPVVSQNYSDQDWPQSGARETPSNTTVGQQLQIALEEKETNGVTDQENPPSGSRVASGQNTPKKAKFFKDWGLSPKSSDLIREESSSNEEATDDSGCGSGKLFGSKRTCKIKNCPPNYNS